MDLFGTMIEVICEMIKTMAPNVGVQVGDDKVSNFLFVDDLTLITENAHDLQSVINIVKMFCLAFSFKFNVTKTEYIVFTKQLCTARREACRTWQRERDQCGLLRHQGGVRGAGGGAQGGSPPSP